ncbi:TetR/AcrR family transcriptional regulator [Actinoplanes couchii]|uniref:TetR family transcriptional regulator n=1 Tax=Actinoplanes couchii TaxID=403638 RepID=A0ABQ3XM28_9ACTN|nr:TetR family transcriptional regulator C-terminal domain-containing protein [Actinoplanes couchii]MDR6319253.1 AcrR family transcriptional regulator [Actinoplanes couchii]GID59538.1 TetR family transcriptional regulator [Actinoplanes couchii]
MPKIVDPQERRRMVADAVHVVVTRNGLEAASLRNVAEEAGLAIGSIRHYFTGHDELLIFALQELGRRVSERVWAHAETILGEARADRRRHTEDLLAEFLPLDAARHDELVLWHEFAMAARTRPALLAQANETHQILQDLVIRTVRGAQAAGGLPADLDVEVEGIRLRALLDGLGMQAVLFPQRFPPELQREVIRRHLDSLVRTGAGDVREERQQ